MRRPSTSPSSTLPLPPSAAPAGYLRPDAREPTPRPLPRMTPALAKSKSPTPTPSRVQSPRERSRTGVSRNAELSSLSPPRGHAPAPGLDQARLRALPQDHVDVMRGDKVKIAAELGRWVDCSVCVRSDTTHPPYTHSYPPPPQKKGTSNAHTPVLGTRSRHILVVPGDRNRCFHQDFRCRLNLSSDIWRERVSDMSANLP